MSDAGIQNVIILKKDLPAIYGKTKQYLIRYRVVSDDRNRVSSWSPQYKIDAQAVNTETYSFSSNQQANTINLVWAPVENISEYYIYVKWNNESWQYLSSTISTSYSCLIKSGATSVKFAVQVPTFPKERFSDLTIFETSSQTL
jgi:hypothetical protein